MTSYANCESYICLHLFHSPSQHCLSCKSNTVVDHLNPYRQGRLDLLSKQQLQQNDGISDAMDGADGESSANHKKAVAIERQLFRSATTLQSYSDLSTLDTRLRSLLMAKLLQRRLTTDRHSIQSSLQSQSQQAPNMNLNFRAKILIKLMGLQRYNTFKALIREIRHEKHVFGSRLRDCASSSSCTIPSTCHPSTTQSSSSTKDDTNQGSSCSPAKVVCPQPNLGKEMPSQVKDLFFESTNILIDAFEKWPTARILKMDKLDWDDLLTRGQENLLKFRSWKDSSASTISSSGSNIPNVVGEEEQLPQRNAAFEVTNIESDEDLLICP